MHNLLVAQSGGPTAAINATLVGILQSALISGKINKVYGAKNGIEGVINGCLVDLSFLLGNTQILDTLMYTPASAMGTCRYKLPHWDQEEAVYKIIVDYLNKYNIKYFIYIGGNDSMDTVNKLSGYCELNHHDIVIIGAPKSIDNDLALTDHSPGFGSAAKYIATTVSEVAYDINSYDIPAVCIIEIMGRNTGWLAAASALARIDGGAGADLIYLSEKTFYLERFLSDVRDKLTQKRSVLIAVSEGIRYCNGRYVSEQTTDSETDDFGHKPISGAARILGQIVRNKIGCKVRSIELNLMQRSAAHISSEADIMEAFLIGQKALYCALEGETGRMVAIKRLSSQPYRINFTTVPVKEIANIEKKVPMNWISVSGNYITKEFMMYLTPLIQGEVNIKFTNGLPKQYKIY